MLLAPLLLAVLQAAAIAQTSERPVVQNCEDFHRSVVPRDPLTTANGDIAPGQVIVQARVRLDASTTVRIVERPRSSSDIDKYNSTIIIRRGQAQQIYPLEQLVKGGSELRLVEIASECTGPGVGLVLLAFESLYTGSAEGFAVIEFSPEQIAVHALPIVNQGRIVIRKDRPEEIELWSALGSASAIDCDACRKYYAVQYCRVAQPGIECKKQPGAGRTAYPDKFMGARIDVH